MLKQQIRSFISSNFYLPEGAELLDDDSLLDKGIIDSTGVLEVIGFLEDSFGFSVDDAEMLPDNLDSIARITQYVARKTAST